MLRCQEPELSVGVDVTGGGWACQIHLCSCLKADRPIFAEKVECDKAVFFSRRQPRTGPLSGRLSCSHHLKRRAERLLGHSVLA